jgi:acyl dehydratase
VIALRRVRDAVFKAPVKIGDEVRVSSTVAGVRPVDEGTELVECRWRILNQDDRLVALAVVELLCHRTPVREPVLI